MLKDLNGARRLWWRQDSCFITTTWHISRWSWHIEEHNEQWFSHSEIQDSLLGAELLGHEQMKVFVARRLCEHPGSDQHLNLKSPIHKNSANTFSYLYEVMQPCKGKHDTINIDRKHSTEAHSCIQSRAWGTLRKHPPAWAHGCATVLATTRGSLHSTNKSVMTSILTQQVEVPANIKVVEPSCLLIDGQALVMALGKPTDIATFGQYGDNFTNTVFN